MALSAGRSALYDGNAGIAWALRTLGRDVGRAAGATEGAPGLLGGSTGVDLAAARTCSAPVGGRGFDLGGGLAGDLLALVRTGSREVAAVVDALVDGARRDGEGACWPEEEALCGLAQNFVQLLLARIGVGVGEAGCTPAITLMSVDLPEPFSPARQWISPRRMVRSTPLSAFTPPKLL